MQDILPNFGVEIQAPNTDLPPTPSKGGEKAVSLWRGAGGGGCFPYQKAWGRGR